ncbi:MAG TPA: hypothetical protein VMT52_15075 [Planctomycetota bacterium]|nr:hypothetical protein [Planctomycetota bacterium]
MAQKRDYAHPRRFRRERIPALEHLDRLDIDPVERSLSYADLDRIGRLPGQFRPLWRAVRRIGRLQGPGRETLRLLEVGAGTGAVGLRLARGLARDGHAVELYSTDLRPDDLPAAGSANGVTVIPLRLHALEDPLPESDIAVANLLIHHLDDSGAVQLLTRLAASSRLGGAVFDLDRNPFAFHLLRLTLPLWARSPITVADALISVQQAFRPEELMDLAERAGIPSPRSSRHLGLRTLLWWVSS